MIEEKNSKLNQIYRSVKFVMFLVKTISFETKVWCLPVEICRFFMQKLTGLGAITVDITAVIRLMIKVLPARKV